MIMEINPDEDGNDKGGHQYLTDAQGKYRNGATIYGNSCRSCLTADVR